MRSREYARELPDGKLWTEKRTEDLHTLVPERTPGLESHQYLKRTQGFDYLRE
jgi:hypothetical protein